MERTRLVLSRIPEETVKLTLPDGVEIDVTVVTVHGDRVRLCFDAPKDVIIHRQEVWDEIQRAGGGRRATG